MSALRGRPWLQTYRGLAWCADEPEIYPYEIYEIAHALSHLCRFAGHCEGFYSVAQHSVLVAREVERMFQDKKPDPALLRAALIHDAAEAFCIDLPAPLKRMPEMEGYRTLIKRTERAISTRFMLSLFEGHELIKHADLVLLATERRDVLGPSPHTGEWMAGLPAARPEVIVPMTPTMAFNVFIDAWRSYGGEGLVAA